MESNGIGLEIEWKSNENKLVIDENRFMASRRSRLWIVSMAPIATDYGGFSGAFDLNFFFEVFKVISNSNVFLRIRMFSFECCTCLWMPNNVIWIFRYIRNSTIHCIVYSPFSWRCLTQTLRCLHIRNSRMPFGSQYSSSSRWTRLPVGSDGTMLFEIAIRL